jgi:cation transport regulator ChaC
VGDGGRWIFGYGSLVWRPDFAFEERAPAEVRGFARRFWQGSPDHRGRHDAPGRVVTLVADPAERCAGVAYRVGAAVFDAVMTDLDLRESGGFERVDVTLHFRAGPRAPCAGVTYVAPPGNANFLGDAPLDEIVAQVARSRGQSGANRDYVLELARALRELDAEDPHVSEIAVRLR